MSTKDTLKKIFSLYNQIDSKVDAFLFLDGKKYELASFQIVFGQPTDHKGQPQHEVKGGQFILTITQTIDDNVYNWGKDYNVYKSGTIRFISETEGTVLEMQFVKASCVSLSHKINAFSGLEISLVVTPAEITLNGILHDNNWRR